MTVGAQYHLIWVVLDSVARVCKFYLMSGVSLTSVLQILEAFWNIWSQVSDFPARGPGMYTLS